MAAITSDYTTISWYDIGKQESPDECPKDIKSFGRSGGLMILKQLCNAVIAWK